MKSLVLVLILITSLPAVAVGSLCAGLFGGDVRILSPLKNYEAFLSSDKHFLKIVHTKNKTEYSYDSRDSLNGFFSLNGHAWIIPKFEEVQIWNFDRVEGNLIRVSLKHSLEFPKVSMHKDPATGHAILKIIYRREKINSETRRFETVTETILKDLETFEEFIF